MLKSTFTFTSVPVPVPVPVNSLVVLSVVCELLFFGSSRITEFSELFDSAPRANPNLLLIAVTGCRFICICPSICAPVDVYVGVVNVNVNAKDSLKHTNCNIASINTCTCFCIFGQ